jgi:NitT/TauT family transport system permease protein
MAAPARLHPPRPVRRRASPPARLVAALSPPLLMGAALCVLYIWGQSRLETYRRFLMPGAGALWEGGFGSAAVRAELFRAATVTAEIALAGLAISIPVGMGLGVLMFRSRFMERALQPYLVALQSVPVLAIIPLLQSLLGFGFLPKVLIVALFTFFAIPTTLRAGLKSIDPGVLDLFRLQGAGWWTTLRKAGLPSALPSLFAGLKISASMAVIGAIVSELFFVSGDGGLGQMLINAKIDFQYEAMYSALIVSSAMSIAVYLAFNWLGRSLLSAWHPAEQDGEG